MVPVVYLDPCYGVRQSPVDLPLCRGHTSRCHAVLTFIGGQCRRARLAVQVCPHLGQAAGQCSLGGELLRTVAQIAAGIEHGDISGAGDGGSRLPPASAVSRDTATSVRYRTKNCAMLIQHISSDVASVPAALSSVVGKLVSDYSARVYCVVAVWLQWLQCCIEYRRVLHCGLRRRRVSHPGSSELSRPTAPSEAFQRRPTGYSLS